VLARNPEFGPKNGKSRLFGSFLAFPGPFLCHGEDSKIIKFTQEKTGDGLSMMKNRCQRRLVRVTLNTIL
jgi:hypothetical protein